MSTRNEYTANTDMTRAIESAAAERARWVAALAPVTRKPAPMDRQTLRNARARRFISNARALFLGMSVFTAAALIAACAFYA